MTVSREASGDTSMGHSESQYEGKEIFPLPERAMKTRRRRSRERLLPSENSNEEEEKLSLLGPRREEDEQAAAKLRGVPCTTTPPTWTNLVAARCTLPVE